MNGTDARLKYEIVTPEGLVFDDHVDMVIVPGELGELGILPQHAPLVSLTGIGEVRIRRSGDGEYWELFAVGAGYVKVQFDRLLMLVDTAEQAAAIDVERARTALKRAEAWLARAGEEGVDVRRAEQSRKRALNRLKVAEKEKKGPVRV